ncbi:MAG: MlaD family protein, partial [Nocardioidaceae bacterium]
MATTAARKSLFANARNRAFGVGFLLLLVGFAYLTYGIFSKSFVSYDDVTLKASKIGLQLPARADVKIRGVRVGEVLAAEPRGGQVDLKLGLYPSQAHIIPENVTARILPKTLFGEKYVALQVPSDPKGSIQAG